MVDDAHTCGKPDYGQITGRGFAGGVRGFGQRLWAYRAAVSMSALIALTLIGIGQLQEIVEMSAATIGFALFPPPGEEWAHFGGLARVVLAVSVISATPVMLWAMAVELWRWRGAGLAEPGWPISFICALPILALTTQMFLLWWQSGLLNGLFGRGDAALLLMPNLVVAAFFLIPLFAVVTLWANARQGPRPRRLGGLPGVAWLVALTMGAAITLLFLAPSSAGPSMGPFAIIGLFAMFLGIIAHFASHIEDKYGLPLTIFLILAAAVLSHFDLNDNHHIRLREAPTSAEPATLDAAFTAWLDCRPEGAPEDVYLVAAQGGGLYAAYQSARFLALVEDARPGFSEQIFAISGVSGGAVGATVFASLMRDMPRRAAGCGARVAGPGPGETPYADRVRQILGQDFLSPVGAAMLFPDFVARFLPRELPAADRARALETAFERAYARAVLDSEEDRADAGLTVPVSAHWSAAGDAPMLILNTTDVSTGTRMIASSPLMDFPAARASTIAEIQRCKPEETCNLPRLSTAMLLSARFPIVTPAGSLDMPPCPDGAEDRRHCNHIPAAEGEGEPSPNPGGVTPKARFVDGGYFENSGLDTVAEIIDAIAPIAAARGVRLRVISFALEDDGIPKRSYGMGEILSPVRALNSARAARVDVARDRVLRLLSDEQPGGAADLLEVKLDARKEGFTLGWVLSRATLTRIDDDLFDARVCNPFVGSPVGEARYEATATEVQVRLDNCRVLAELDALLPWSSGGF